MTDRTTSAKGDQILVRLLKEVDEMHACIELQRKIWGYSETDLVPEAMLVVALETGGQVIAAFYEQQPIGFALAFAGWHFGGNYLHSHLVGVLPEFRDRGVGRMLKLRQREDALARGFSLIEWTFDPLQLKNAHFNLASLGAIARQYRPNLYGRTSSPLHAGLPTDRLVAEWWTCSERVDRALACKKAAPHARRSLVSIRRSIRELCTYSPQEAESIQSQLREQFQYHFAAGYAAVGFELDKENGSYILEPYED